MSTALQVDVGDVQKYLQKNKLDGWLIYDFFGLNRVASDMIRNKGKFLTRRWYYFIPAQGKPTLVVHKIENRIFPKVPGNWLQYAGRLELAQILKDMLAKAKCVAMEYSPDNDIPTNSFVDAGTVEMIRGFGVEVVSSANLIQYFRCRLSDAQVASHKFACDVLYNAQKAAYEHIETHLRDGKKITEFDIQEFIWDKIQAKGMDSISRPIVAVNANASDPHYAPTADEHTEIKKGDCILIDLWAKQETPGAVYGDITWCGFAGKEPPAEYAKIWKIDCEARDKSIELLESAHEEGRVVHGYEVDEVVRQHIENAGYGAYFFHRTGHSIDEDDHGKGVNIDSYETKDSREIIPGLCFSIEPGIYLPKFGVRTEIDIFYSEDGPRIFTPVQQDLILMDL